jgi:hypothetical protein
LVFNNGVKTVKTKLKNADNKNKITNSDLYFFGQEIIGIIMGYP